MPGLLEIVGPFPALENECRARPPCNKKLSDISLFGAKKMNFLKLSLDFAITYTFNLLNECIEVNMKHFSHFLSFCPIFSRGINERARKGGKGSGRKPEPTLS